MSKCHDYVYGEKGNAGVRYNVVVYVTHKSLKKISSICYEYIPQYVGWYLADSVKAVELWYRITCHQYIEYINGVNEIEQKSNSEH